MIAGSPAEKSRNTILVSLNARLKKYFLSGKSCFTFPNNRGSQEQHRSPLRFFPSAPAQPVLSRAQPRQEPRRAPRRPLLTRTNSTIAFCSANRAWKGTLLPSASSTGQRAASRSRCSSGRRPQPRARPTCCVTGGAGPAMAARTGEAEPGGKARGGVRRRGSDGMERSGSFPAVGAAPGPGGAGGFGWRERAESAARPSARAGAQFVPGKHRRSHPELPGNGVQAGAGTASYGPRGRRSFCGRPQPCRGP